MKLPDILLEPGQEYACVQDAIQALADCAPALHVYQYEGKLVRVVHGRIKPLTSALLTVLFPTFAVLYVIDKDGERAVVRAPSWLVAGLLALGDWPDIPSYTGVPCGKQSQ